jgi:hypothetical protein
VTSWRFPGTGRYPPQPKFEPFAFYSCFRLGDPEQAAIIMETDPYFWTQDNGAGGPVHFSTTYKQIDMLHHILRNCPQAVNQRDVRGPCTAPRTSRSTTGTKSCTSICSAKAPIPRS